jgi:serine-type D-Ala-D-Ala carboxypeptidase/endopeptidase
MLRNQRNPYAAYTSRDLIDYLSHYKPRPNSIGLINYSNLGGGLLGFVLARRVGVSYEEAVIARICEPLGLNDTRVTLTPEQNARLATPHAGNGKPTRN